MLATQKTDHGEAAMKSEPGKVCPPGGDEGRIIWLLESVMARFLQGWL